MKPWDAIVVGAGVGGASCALALAHEHDLRVLLVERHRGPGNLNRGESLLPPITRLLNRWGALARCRAAGAREVRRMQFFHYRAGLLLDMPLALPCATDPYLVLPHPEIERAIVETAEATGRVEIRYRTRVARLLKHDGRVCGAVLGSDAGEEEVAARIVVGADGAGSAVRAGIGVELARAPYNHSLFIVDIDRPDNHPDVLRTELHPDGGILVVPGIGRLGLAVVVRREHEHLFRAGSIEEKFSHFEHRSPLLAGRHPSPVGAHLYKLWRGHAPAYRAPGVALIGDAVHVINPVMAQGMTMAIEDAAALVRCVGPALEAGANGEALDAAAAAYERERRPFNAAVIRNSHRMSLLFCLGGAVGDMFHRCVFGFANSWIGHLTQRKVWSKFATSPEVLYA